MKEHGIKINAGKTNVMRLNDTENMEVIAKEGKYKLRSLGRKNIWVVTKWN